MRQTVVQFLLAFFLVGCTSIPLSSISKLSALRPDTIALEKVQVAVRAPEDYRIYRDGATLKMSITGPAFEEPRTLELELVPSLTGLTPFLEGRQRRGDHIAVFKVDPEDAADINTFRDDAVMMLEQNPGENTISTTAWARGCLAQGANPFQDLRMAVYLRPDPNEEFFTLFKGTKIGSIEEGTSGSICTEEDAPRLLWTQ